jgi:hypothetical protein
MKTKNFAAGLALALVLGAGGAEAGVKVIYGAFTDKGIVTGSRANCSNATFGDPAPGYVKACYDIKLEKRADEGKEFVAGPGSTIYGKVVVKDFPNAKQGDTISCNNATFGDPARGIKKRCHLDYGDGSGSGTEENGTLSVNK